MDDQLRSHFRNIMKDAYMRCAREHENAIIIGSAPDDFEPFRMAMFEYLTGIFLMNSDAGFVDLPNDVRVRNIIACLTQFTNLALNTFERKLAQEALDAGR